MTAAADLVVRGGEIHLDGKTFDAVAVRDGRVVRRSNDYEADFLTGVETTVVELNGRTVFPGFVDARAELGSVEALRSRTAEGVTTVHARADPERAAAVRDAADADDFIPDVRLQYPESLRSALLDAGLRTNHGGRVRVGALTIPTAETGFAERAVRAAEAGFQVALEVTTREAADDAVAALAACRGERHRIEGAVPTSGALADFEGVVVTDGRSDGLTDAVASDATLALGGDEPLRTLSRAVESGLDPETALRAHTRGGRIAGFAEGSSAAEFVAFDDDPLKDPETASVALTVARGEVVHDALD